MMIICSFHRECQEISQGRKNKKKDVKRNGVQGVGGSNPLVPTRYFKGLAKLLTLFYLILENYPTYAPPSTWRANYATEYRKFFWIADIGKIVRIDLPSIPRINYLRSHLRGKPRIGDWLGF